jgi:probable rRNA maturation factor
MSDTIHFFTENIKFNLRNRNLLRKWIRLISRAGNKQAGEINFIFCDDDFLGGINIKYLKHNTLTDIITFSFSEEEQVISGDVYISIPRVRENALKFKVEFTAELYRVMIHGILHLMGFEDATKAGQKSMREEENRCLAIVEKLER